MSASTDKRDPHSYLTFKNRRYAIILPCSNDVVHITLDFWFPRIATHFLTDDVDDRCRH